PARANCNFPFKEENSDTLVGKLKGLFRKESSPAVSGPRPPGGVTPVGSYPPNPFGLHDTAGNVWEWVQDCWQNDYEGAPADGSAVLSKDCALRVVRGGSWDFEPDCLRSAFRFRADPVKRNRTVGFRLAQDL
ncbi:MAG: formylglycine-generating enzyme family protein, partial [Gammaproteobacteria bacterium]|nr:formylglycine-generating enzyme family protein [Gammaproteobacteria bacterium]